MNNLVPLVIELFYLRLVIRIAVVVLKNSIRLPSDRDVGTYLFGLRDLENPGSQLGWQKIPVSGELIRWQVFASRSPGNPKAPGQVSQPGARSRARPR